MAEGADLIIGPLFAGSVRSAGQVARQAGKPVIAFSTDATVATRGVYLLSFLVQAEVDRIVCLCGLARAALHRRAGARRRPMAASPRRSSAKPRRGSNLRVVAIERYPAGPAASRRATPRAR